MNIYYTCPSRLPILSYYLQKMYCIYCYNYINKYYDIISFLVKWTCTCRSRLRRAPRAPSSWRTFAAWPPTFSRTPPNQGHAKSFKIPVFSRLSLTDLIHTGLPLFEHLSYPPPLSLSRFELKIRRFYMGVHWTSSWIWFTVSGIPVTDEVDLLVTAQSILAVTVVVGMTILDRTGTP